MDGTYYPNSLFLYLRDSCVQCFSDRAEQFISAKLFHAIDITTHLVARGGV
jgi:hypothetical protein